MNLPKYPDDFFTYENGVEISDEKINDWIGHCVFELSNTVHTYSLASGNTKVEATKDDDGIITITVCKGRSEFHIYPNGNQEEF